MIRTWKALLLKIKKLIFKCRRIYVDSSYIYGISEDAQKLAIFDKSSIAILQMFEFEQPILRLDMSSKYIIVETVNSIVVFDKKRFVRLLEFKVDRNKVSVINYDESSDVLFIGLKDGKILVINNFSEIPDIGEISYEIKLLDPKDEITFISSGQYLYVGCRSGRLYIIEKRSLEIIVSLRYPSLIIDVVPINESEGLIEIIVLHENGTLRKYRILLNSPYS